MTDVSVPTVLAQLVARSRKLGADRSICNWGGGNTSAKADEVDFRGRRARILWVKGSGSDLASVTEASFTGLYMADVLPLLDRERMSDSEMVDYLAHCFYEPDRPRPSIETLLHGFLPFAHIDHTHADATNYFACAEGGEAEEVFRRSTEDDGALAPRSALERVDDLPVELHFPVEMRAVREPRLTNDRDRFAPRDALAHRHEDRACVVVAGLETAAVLQADPDPALAVVPVPDLGLIVLRRADVIELGDPRVHHGERHVRFLAEVDPRLVHGKGKGVQRAEVQRLLRRLPGVVSFEDAPPVSGGWGATLVLLRPPDTP